MEQAVGLLALTLTAHALVTDERRAVLEAVQQYTRAWRLILDYDERRLAERPAVPTAYRDLNSVKFKVIHELEQRMPEALYDYEWQKVEEGRGKAYHPVSHLELSVPIIFMVLYVLLAALTALRCVR